MDNNVTISMSDTVNDSNFHTCNTCFRSKRLTSINFYRNKNNHTGFQYACKVCFDNKRKTKPIDSLVAKCISCDKEFKIDPFNIKTACSFKCAAKTTIPLRRKINNAKRRDIDDS